MTASGARFAVALAALAAVTTAQEVMHGAVRTIDGRTLTGAFAVAGSVATVTTNAGAVRIDVGEMVSFERADAVAALANAPHRVWLRSGLELPAMVLGGAAAANGKPATVHVETPGGLVLDVPLGLVRAIRHAGKERPEPALFATDLQQPPSSEDLIYVLKDGTAQRSSVVLKALTKERIDFVLRGSEYEFPTSGVAAVVFGANTGFPPDRQARPRTSVLLTTGERIEGRLLAADGSGVAVRLDEGVEVRVAPARLLSLQVASDRLAWLSELKPKIEQTPAFDRVWPCTFDRTPAGPGIMLGGKLFAHGVCMVPRARLTYDLGGRYDVFEATIGIDDRGGPEAHALLRVLVDGAVVFDSGPRTRGLVPQTVRIELHKCKTLALEADFGKNYDLGDHCVFADARVVQQ